MNYTPIYREIDAKRNRGPSSASGRVLTSIHRQRFIINDRDGSTHFPAWINIDNRYIHFFYHLMRDNFKSRVSATTIKDYGPVNNDHILDLFSEQNDIMPAAHWYNL